MKKPQQKPFVAVAARHLFEISGTATVLTGLISEWVKSRKIDFVLCVPERRDGKSKHLGPWGKKILKIPGDSSKPIEWLASMEKVLIHAFPDRKILVFYPNLDLPKVSKLPFVSLIHDVMPVHLPEYRFHPIKYWAFKKAVRRHLQGERVVTVSEFSCKDLLTHFPEFQGRVDVIANGISPSYSPAKTRTKKKYFLYVGDLRRRKNVFSWAKAYAGLPGEIQREYDFAFTGSGPERVKIETFLAAKGLKKNTKALGRVDERELPGLYRNASLFVFPSLYEGFGLPVLEAQASGIPVICGDNSSLGEVAAGSAEICDVKDPKSIAQAVLRVTTHEKYQKSLIQKGLRNAKNYTWLRAARNYEKVFQGLPIERYK